MAKNFNSWKQIEAHITSKLVKAMGKDMLGKDIVQITQEHITDDVYGTYNAKSYLASGEFLESVVSTEPSIAGNEVQISVEHDTSRMEMRDPWYHQSVIDGRDVREALPEIIHDGKTYDLWGHGDAAYLRPRPYMDNTREELRSTKKHVKYLAKHLRSLGLDAREG